MRTMIWGIDPAIRIEFEISIRNPTVENAGPNADQVGDGKESGADDEGEQHLFTVLVRDVQSLDRKVAQQYDEPDGGNSQHREEAENLTQSVVESVPLLRGGVLGGELDDRRSQPKIERDEIGRDEKEKRPNAKTLRSEFRENERRNRDPEEDVPDPSPTG